MSHYHCPTCFRAAELWSSLDYLRGYASGLSGIPCHEAALTILAIEAILGAEA